MNLLKRMFSLWCIQIYMSCVGKFLFVIIVFHSAQGFAEKHRASGDFYLKLPIDHFVGDDGLTDILVVKNLLGIFTYLSICWKVCRKVEFLDVEYQVILMILWFSFL